MTNTPEIPLFFDPLLQTGSQEQGRPRRRPSSFRAPEHTRRQSTPLNRSRALELVATDLDALQKRRANIGPRNADPA